MTKVGVGRGMVRSLQNRHPPLIFFAMDVPNKRYYIEKTVNINVKKCVYTSVIDSHIKNNKNWNCEFICGALRRCDDMLYN